VTKLEEMSDKVMVERIKTEWRQLWIEHFDDKVRAEGVSLREFPLCFVDQGTIIVATRDFKPLDLKEILRLNKIQRAEQFVPPPPKVGGWRKFARTVLNKQKRRCSYMLENSAPKRAKNLQLKKGGRGWLHNIS
jgi:hypothetical protein